MDNSYHSENSEASILATVLFSSEAISKVIIKLKPKDFYIHLHKVIYEAILSLNERGRKIDIVTVRAELEEIHGKDFIMEKQPGAYMVGLEGDRILPGNIDYHIEVIKAKALKRNILKYIGVIEEKLSIGEGVDPILYYMDNTLFDIKKKRLGQEFKPLNLYLEEKWERDNKRKSGELLGYELNRFSTIQDNIEGIQSGVYLLGAYTNMGKTTFLTNIFLNLIQVNSKLRGIYLSLDDSRDTIIERLVSILSGLSINEVKKGQPDIKEKREAIIEARNTLNRYANMNRMEIVDVSMENPLLYIETEIRKNLGNIFICIDDLHNLELSGSYDTPRDLNIAIANTIKRYTRIYKLPILATVEMRKPQGSSMDKPPSINDTMETGKYGYNADIFWIIHPKDIDEFNEGRDTTLMLYYQKNKLSEHKRPQSLKWIRGTGTLKELKIERR